MSKDTLPRVIALSLVAGLVGHATAGGTCPSTAIDSDSASNASQFGRAVDCAGPVAIVGAEDDDEGGDAAGAAFIFRLVGSNWAEEAKLLPTDVDPGANFGAAVAVDGDVAVVGAPGQSDQGEAAGAAWVFRYDGALWNSEGQLLTGTTGVGDGFGRAVDVQGDLAVIGSASAAYVFRFDSMRSQWSLETKLEASEEANGFGYAVSIDAGRIGVGSLFQAAYVFRSEGNGVWVEEAVLHAIDTDEFTFGQAVAMRAELAVVGSPGDSDIAFNSGAAYVFRRAGTKWTQEVKLRPPDGNVPEAPAGYPAVNFGRGVAATVDKILIGAPTSFNPGLAYLFRFDGSTWVLEHQLQGNSSGWDFFGGSVSIDGQTALVGSAFDERAFVFNLDELATDCDSGSAACASDCNGNGQPDVCDVTDGVSDDCNENQIPDECELDCNGNGVPDDCDLSAGTSLDCNGNGIPDDCEADCNGNMITDACDIDAGTSVDCDGNGVPDECESDCNNNGVVDACDITDGTDTDCNGNGVLDGCEFAAGTIEDCNENAVPDSCELNDYQLDDGTMEFFLGVVPGADLIWLNQFEVQPGAETIRFVSVAWPDQPAGAPATVLLYDDPDNDADPTDAVLLAMAPTIVAGMGQFIVVAVPETLVGSVGDSFFVGVSITTEPVEFPIGSDASSPYQQRSWFAYAAPGEGDVEDLTNNLFPIQRNDAAGFAGNYLIRADVQPPAGVPRDCAVSGDANADGIVDVNDLLLVILNWGSCTPPLVLCPGDLTGNGVVGVEDLVAVLLGWTAR